MRKFILHGVQLINIIERPLRIAFSAAQVNRRNALMG